MLIYKIAVADDWTEAARRRVFEGSAKDKEDGFIHFSTAEQLIETLKLHYSGNQRMLALSAVEAEALGESLKWKPSRNGDLFPHLYGHLPMTAVRSTVVAFYFSLAEDGFRDVHDFINGTGVFADTGAP
jgi:uncharacterized protein (DUF952 family)